MLPDWVSNPGPLTYESGALPIALRGPAVLELKFFKGFYHIWVWWPYWSFEHIFVPSAPGGSKWDLVTIGSVAYEEMFEIVIL